MDSTLVNIATRTLKHHGVPVCIVGELARNYYNVLRVCHDLEICVPETSSLVAAGLLCSTGLFEPWVHDGNFNNYTEYKRGMPRVRTAGCASPSRSMVIFPASLFGLDPIEHVLVPPGVDRQAR
ncbi:hypothetical protein RJ55_06888 [Drechmeria coniospora]|nr:hypothetical protein RJ55_06888 [Drechmeria coniospora]